MKGSLGGVAIGSYAYAKDYGATAIGYQSSGGDAVAGGNLPTAIGYTTNASRERSVAIGAGSACIGTRGISIGSEAGSTGNGNSGINIGDN